MNHESLIHTYGSPLYVYDANSIRTRISELRNNLTTYPNTRYLYAVKANYNPTIVRLITSHGIGVDAVTIEEVRLALACGVPPDMIILTENNISDADMHAVHDLGVVLNIGSLSRLRKFAAAFPGDTVSIRLNPAIGDACHETNITGGEDSKFGIAYSDIPEVLEIVAEGNLKIIGIHHHIGSGWLRTDAALVAFDRTVSHLHHFPGVEFLDLGGGFGRPYHKDDVAIDFDTLSREITSRMERCVVEYGRPLRLQFEPGRYFVQDACVLLTRVTTLKQTMGGNTVVGLDTGMNQLIRPAFYGSYHHIVNLTNPDGPLEAYDITGNVCEHADYFARERVMPQVREGDILAIECAGAYGMSMASNYQFRALPAEVLVDGDDVTCIRKRETFEDLMAMYPPAS